MYQEPRQQFRGQRGGRRSRPFNRPEFRGLIWPQQPFPVPQQHLHCEHLNYQPMAILGPVPNVGMYSPAVDDGSIVVPVVVPRSFSIPPPVFPTLNQYVAISQEANAQPNVQVINQTSSKPHKFSADAPVFIPASQQATANYDQLEPQQVSHMEKQSVVVSAAGGQSHQVPRYPEYVNRHHQGSYYQRDDNHHSSPAYNGIHSDTFHHTNDRISYKRSQHPPNPSDIMKPKTDTHKLTSKRPPWSDMTQQQTASILKESASSDIPALHTQQDLSCMPSIHSIEDSSPAQNIRKGIHEQNLQSQENLDTLPGHENFPTHHGNDQFFNHSYSYDNRNRPYGNYNRPSFYNTRNNQTYASHSQGAQNDENNYHDFRPINHSYNAIRRGNNFGPNPRMRTQFINSSWYGRPPLHSHAQHPQNRYGDGKIKRLNYDVENQTQESYRTHDRGRSADGDFNRGFSHWEFDEELYQNEHQNYRGRGHYNRGQRHQDNQPQRKLDEEFYTSRTKYNQLETGRQDKSDESFEETSSYSDVELCSDDSTNLHVDFKKSKELDHDARQSKGPAGNNLGELKGPDSGSEHAKEDPNTESQQIKGPDRFLKTTEGPLNEAIRTNGASEKIEGPPSDFIRTQGLDDFIKKGDPLSDPMKTQGPNDGLDNVLKKGYPSSDPIETHCSSNDLRQTKGPVHDQVDKSHGQGKEPDTDLKKEKYPDVNARNVKGVDNNPSRNLDNFGKPGEGPERNLERGVSRNHHDSNRPNNNSSRRSNNNWDESKGQGKSFNFNRPDRSEQTRERGPISEATYRDRQQNGRSKTSNNNSAGFERSNRGVHQRPSRGIRHSVQRSESEKYSYENRREGIIYRSSIERQSREEDRENLEDKMAKNKMTTRQNMVILDDYSSDLNLIVDSNGFGAFTVDTPLGFGKLWADCKATHGVNKGKSYFEVKLIDLIDTGSTEENDQRPNVLRIGWSVENAAFEAKTGSWSFGYKESREFFKGDSFCESTVKDDVLGAMVNFETDPVEITYLKNGEALGQPSLFIPLSKNCALFPHISLKNCKVRVNFGQREPLWYPPPEGYTFIGKSLIAELVQSLAPPLKKSDCELIMMIGLPGCGKTTWALRHQEEHRDRRYNILSTDLLVELMSTSKNGLEYSEIFQEFNALAEGCHRRLLTIASMKARNYILDEANVQVSSRAEKLRKFHPFVKRAMVIQPSNRELEERDSKTNKKVPEAVLKEMKANFTLPEHSDDFKFIEFVGLKEQDARELIEKYNDNNTSNKSPMLTLD